MPKEEILIEVAKCKASPYYFATKHILMVDKEGNKTPFKTTLTEKEFNDYARTINRKSHPFK